MKIALVYPQPKPLCSSKGKYGVPEGLGLLYLATMIKNEHEVQIFGNTINSPTTAELIQALLEFHPDVLGISTVFSTLMTSGKEIAGALRESIPGIKIVFGGNHSHFVAKQLASEPFVDAIVIGEGEYTFKELVQAYSEGKGPQGIEGIVFQENGQIVENPKREPIQNLDELPYPDRSLIIEEYPAKYRVPISSSRGCPYHCIYCSTTAFWGNHWRKRSAQNVFGEMLYIADNFFKDPKEPVFFGFSDDNFTIDRKRVLDLCEMIRDSGRGFTWGASSRLELIDLEFLKGMVRGGCKELFFGVESGSEPVLKQMNRHYDIEKIHRVVTDCISVGVIPVLSFIIGLPYEDAEDIKRTVSLINSVASYKVQVHIFTPFIGTSVNSDPESYGIELLSSSLEELNLEQRCFINTQHLKATQIEEAYLKAMGVVARRYRESTIIEAKARASAIQLSLIQE